MNLTRTWQTVILTVTVLLSGIISGYSSAVAHQSHASAAVRRSNAFGLSSSSDPCLKMNQVSNDDKNWGSVLTTIDGVNVYDNGGNPNNGCTLNSDGSNSYPYGSKYQCVELIQRYFVTITNGAAPNRWNAAYAFQLFDNLPNGFVRSTNGQSSTPPQHGDALVFSGGSTFTDPNTGKPVQAGHVALVTDVVNGKVWVVDQNFSGEQTPGINSFPIDGKNNVTPPSGFNTLGWLHWAGPTNLAPNGVTPNNGIVFPQGTNITLTWSASPGASGYNVQYSGPASAGESTTSTSWNVGVLPLGSYNWSVTPIFPSASGKGSTAWFSIGQNSCTSRTAGVAPASRYFAAKLVAPAGRSLSATSCSPPLPSNADITVTNETYPPTVGPGAQFVPQITVKVNTGDLEQARGDMLRCADTNCDSHPALRFGAYQLVAVQGTVGTGQSYTFAFYANYPMTAPSALGTYTSNWRVWRNGAWIGPTIPITFTVQQSACITPPMTSSSVSGATPGLHGWWRSPVTVTLTASATCGSSGLKTYYSVDGGSRTTYTGPIALSQEGVYTLSYYSVDGVGNTENAWVLQAKLDWTPPTTTGTASGPRDTNGIFRDSVTITLSATDTLSGVDYEQFSLDGGTTWMKLAGSSNSFLIAGNGVARVLFRTADVAGNVEQAHDSGPIIINKYVIFSNGQGPSLRLLYGTNVAISGDLYSNGSATLSWNTGSTLGNTLGTVGSGNSADGNTNTQLPVITNGRPPVPMLAYPLSQYQSSATAVFPADLYVDSVNTTLSGLIYVQGNVELDAVNLGGSVSFVATGTITDMTTDSSFQTGDPHNGVLLYAGTNIVVQSTGNRNLGLLYAPNGTVQVQATNLTLQGSLVGNQVEVNGASGFTLSYSAAFSSGTYPLPLTAMGLVGPSAPPPPLPSVPALVGPTGGTVNAKVGLSWQASNGAVGYQVQVATSSSFDPSTLVRNVCRLSTSDSAKLAAGTTYYWRVRAINQAGMSAWSTVASFKTK